MTSQRTFIMVKPDGVKRGLIGEIIKRFEQKDFTLLHAELMTVDRTKAEYHYMEHQSKPFFGELVEFITSGPVFAMVWEGENIIELSRLMIGKTSPNGSNARYHSRVTLHLQKKRMSSMVQTLS